MGAQFRVALTAVDDRGACTSCSFDEAFDPLDVLEVDVGPDLSLLLTRVTLPNLRSALDESLLERIGDALLHQQSGAGKTHLTRVVVLLDREVDG